MTDQNLAEGVRRFAQRELATGAAQVDRNAAFPEHHWAKLAEIGLAGLVAPAQYGGLAVDRGTFTAALETVGRACASSAWVLLTHCAAVAGLAAQGSEAQREQYLLPLAAGTLAGAVGVTETGGGSSPGAIKTFARAEGSDFVLDGGKFFISEAGVADVYLVLARMAAGEEPAALGCFIVEKTDAGVSFGKREETMGLRGVEVREIFFDQCRLPAERLLGRPGGAQAVMGAVSGIALSGAAAVALGIAQAAYDDTLAHVKSRTVLGKPLASAPGVQARVAQILFELEGARAWLARAVAWLDGGAQGAPLPLWMAKVSITQAALRVTDGCLALHGAVGYSRALPLERHVRDLHAFCIHWGNNDVLTDMVGHAAVA